MRQLPGTIALNLTYREPTRRRGRKRRFFDQRIKLSITTVPFRFVQGDIKVFVLDGEHPLLRLLIFHQGHLAHEYLLEPQKQPTHE